MFLSEELPKLGLTQEYGYRYCCAIPVIPDILCTKIITRKEYSEVVVGFESGSWMEFWYVGV